MGGGGVIFNPKYYLADDFNVFLGYFRIFEREKFKDGGQPLAKVKTKHPFWSRLPLARLLGTVRAGNMGGVWVKGWA